MGLLWEVNELMYKVLKTVTWHIEGDLKWSVYRNIFPNSGLQQVVLLVSVTLQQSLPSALKKWNGCVQSGFPNIPSWVLLHPEGDSGFDDLHSSVHHLPRSFIF